MSPTVDLLLSVVPVVLVTAMIILISRSVLDGRTDMVTGMKQALGATVMLLVALMVIFAFSGDGGGGDDPEDPDDPDEPVPDPEFTVSGGRLTVSSDVPSYRGSPWSSEDLALITIGTDVETIGAGAFTGTDADILFEGTPQVEDGAFAYPFDGEPGPGYWMVSNGAYVQVPEVPVEMLTFTVADSAATLTGVSEDWTVPDLFVMAVPEEYEGSPVTKINMAAAWQNLRYIESSTISTLSSNVFRYAGDLITVDLPAVTSVSIRAFNQCLALKAVSLPAATTVNISAFQYCASLEYISLPAATTVNDTAFQYCASLEYISLPAATTVGSHAFSHCSSLSGFSLPLITYFGDSQFSYCISLRSIEDSMAASVTGIAASSFSNCMSLEKVSLTRVTSVGTYSFNECNMLKQVSLPALESINDHGFYKCTSIAEVSLPSCRTVSTNAFDMCTAIETIHLPSCRTLGNYAFSSAGTSVTSITLGPLTSYGTSAFPSSWIFYDTDGTTVLTKNAANLKDSTFQGVYNALVKVDPNRGLTPEMERRVAELSAENSLKASMLAALDPELADMDPDDVARMTPEDVRSLSASGVQALKESVQDAKLSMLAGIDPDLASLTREDASRLTKAGIASLTPEEILGLKAVAEQRRSGSG